MSRGCLIFAYDGTLDYGSQAVLAATLASKHLQVPVSVVTDQATEDSMRSKFNQLPFDKIIKIDNNSNNYRALGNGVDSERIPTQFKNNNRSSAYDLTPYDRTLVIDSDFLIFSNELDKYWDSRHDFLITPGMLDLQETSVSSKGYKLSPYTIDMLWATNLMFSKTDETKLLFDLVEYIKENYQYYAGLYEFSSGSYRNDFAFSVACHIMSGHGADKWHGELPVPLLHTDLSELVNIKDNGQLTFLLKDRTKLDNFVLSNSYQQDIHMMNKQDILSNIDKFMELANV
jgi:hypothetical protein